MSYSATPSVTSVSSGSSAPLVLGVRHHGPGSARSVASALEEFRPDIVLIEGPPDAAEIIPLAADPAMHPPVALLVYATEQPANGVFYPFAPFSPEWVALRHGLDRGAPVRFIDLPQGHQMALKNDPETEEKDSSPADDNELYRHDPLQLIALADGFGDGERWWEYMVEERKESIDLFAAILTLMTALRREAEISEEENPGKELRREELREAFMRTMIRKAQREGYERIAVICGAWHSPALHETEANESAEKDAVLLRNLPAIATTATWIPWTYGRLALRSGYGAGIASPGYYHHLWESPNDVVSRWMTQTARLLREEDLSASPASVIEGVRLAEALAGLRRRHTPGLEELLEASQAVFCFGSDVPMRLIEERLLLNDRIGTVPESVPYTPLYRDLLHLQKQLRLKPDADGRELELDLRKELDLERSRLFHRLAILGVEWGTPRPSYGGGTFREVWHMQWHPEFVVRIIEAGTWGTTIREAADAAACRQAGRGETLQELTALINRVLPADLHKALEETTARIQRLAALTGDVLHLMQALPPLANLLRYGSVRGTDTEVIAQVVHGMVARSAIGLPTAGVAVNDEAAEEIFAAMIEANGAIALLQDEELLALWEGALVRLTENDNVHGLVAGRALRILLDQQMISDRETARQMALRLSPASPAAQATLWLDGFIRDSGLLLVHDITLWEIIDRWVASISRTEFQQTLPLLRRIFSTFAPAERRQIGERARSRTTSGKPAEPTATTAEDYDSARGDMVIPILDQILGRTNNT